MIRIIPNPSGKTIQLLKIAELFYGANYDGKKVFHCLLMIKKIIFVKYECFEEPYNQDEAINNITLHLFETLFLTFKWDLFIQKPF